MPIARGDAPRVVQIVERAAACRTRGRLALVVELHRQTDDVVALLGEQRRGDRGVDAARHRDDDRAWRYASRGRSAVRPRRRAASSTQARQHARPRDRSSASVVAAPRLKRIEFCVRCGGKPIAFSTCDGSSVPDEQADPVDTAMPSRSSAISSDSASTPIEADVGRVRHARRGGAVDGGAAARARGCPARAGRAAPRAACASRGDASRARVARRRPEPTMPATFSVPARRLRSCRPPVDRAAAAARPRRIHSAPDALRAVELVRRDRQQVDAERLDVDRDLAGGLHRVGVEQRAAARARARRARRSAGWCRSRCWRA